MRGCWILRSSISTTSLDEWEEMNWERNMIYAWAYEPGLLRWAGDGWHEYSRLAGWLDLLTEHGEPHPRLRWTFIHLYKWPTWNTQRWIKEELHHHQGEKPHL